MKYFNEWKDLLSKCITCNIEKNNNITIHKFKCDCSFEFRYLSKKDQFEITCQNSKLNIIDIICEHIPCLISKKKFIDETLKLESYKKWIENSKKN